MISINTRYRRLVKKAEVIRQQINDLQVECAHTGVKKEYKGNTGNWDPNDNCYWINFSCPDCGKFWREDQ